MNDGCAIQLYNGCTVVDLEYLSAAFEYDAAGANADAVVVVDVDDDDAVVVVHQH